MAFAIAATRIVQTWPRANCLLRPGSGSAALWHGPVPSYVPSAPLGATWALAACAALHSSHRFRSSNRGRPPTGWMRRPAAFLSTRSGLGSSSPAEALYTIPEHGDALQAGPDGTGGWLAHRFLLQEPGSGPGTDWIREVFADPDGACGADLSSAAEFAVPSACLTHRPRILILYGSLRERSFSKLLAYECARLLDLLGADVRVYDPRGLPVRDPILEQHPKVQELRSLSLWSEGHVWVSPEMHGCITGAFKNQIDWLPLNTGSVRPTQGRTCVVLQVNGGSQSFNAVNEMRRLARWMRMPCSTNQSSVAKAWQEFDDDGRMKPSGFRERVVDVVEEFYKFTLIMREHADFLVDRYSERKEVAAKGKLLTQAEKEAEKKLKDEAAAEAAAAGKQGSGAS